MTILNIDIKSWPDLFNHEGAASAGSWFGFGSFDIFYKKFHCYKTTIVNL